jgi:hypothetical protein
MEWHANCAESFNLESYILESYILEYFLKAGVRKGGAPPCISRLSLAKGHDRGEIHPSGVSVIYLCARHQSRRNALRALIIDFWRQMKHQRSIRPQIILRPHRIRIAKLNPHILRYLVVRTNVL